MAFIAGGAGGLGLIVALILIFYLAAMLKIPDLAQNIGNYEFARMSRQFADSAQAVTDESLAVEAGDDASYIGWQETFANATGAVKDTWSKLDQYRPAKVIQTWYGDSSKPSPPGLLTDYLRYAQPAVLTSLFVHSRHATSGPGTGGCRRGGDRGQYEQTPASLGTFFRGGG